MDCEICEEHLSYYPGCSIILSTAYTEKITCVDKDGNTKEWEDVCYKEEEEQHGHEGIWTFFWLGKTNYDYGFGEYYFQKESDRDRFLEVICTNIMESAKKSVNFESNVRKNS
jgi:hypothetical protein